MGLMAHACREGEGGGGGCISCLVIFKSQCFRVSVREMEKRIKGEGGFDGGGWVGWGLEKERLLHPELGEKGGEDQGGGWAVC